MAPDATTALIHSVYGELFTQLLTPYPELESSEFGRSLADDTAQLLGGYVELLESWTSRVDLVSESDRETLVERHVIDCLAAWMVFSVLAKPSLDGRVLDIGSGAGLPGLVWAVLERSRPVTLCEPREKRAIFLKEARRILKLENVEVLTKRAETLMPEDVAGLAVVTSRALGDEELILNCAATLLNSSGWCALMVGANWQNSHDEKFQLWRHLQYALPRSQVPRGIAVYRLHKQ